MAISASPALTAWLRANVPGLSGPVRLHPLAGGQSNPTYAVESDAVRVVLRRKPDGPLLPSAHAVDREFRILAALGSTGIPVPRVYALCEDATIAGTPFYVMEYLSGRVFDDPALPGIAPDERQAIYESAFATLADMHRIDFGAIGLTDFGRPDGYLARQVHRWTTQYRATQTDELPSMEALIAWLPVHVPADTQAAIAHGDYRLGNVMFDRREPRVIGILDWELSTIGHPLLDAAYALLMHKMPADIVRGFGGSVALAGIPGIPTATELLASYGRHAQRSVPADMRFYFALAFFRSAGIMQGIRHRISLGNAAGGAGAELRAAIAPRLAELGWACAQGALG